MNDLYRNELCAFQNSLQPSIKLMQKVRIGSTMKRVYDVPKTPFERVIESGGCNPAKVAALQQWKGTLDPFELAATIDRKLEVLCRMASTGQASPDMPRPF